MKITLNDGQTFEAETAAGIVRQMRDIEWSAPPRKGEYMHEVSRRLGGPDIRTSDPEVFLFDLERAGLCRIESLTDAQADRWTTLAEQASEETPGNTAPTSQMPQDNEEPDDPIDRIDDRDMRWNG